MFLGSKVRLVRKADNLTAIYALVLNNSLFNAMQKCGVSEMCD
jgi:hypothetical protein